MSRLTELLSQVANLDSALADDLRREVGVLSSRRQFGLNFERHVPESVQLPTRRVRRGDKVVLREAAGADQRTWVVVGIESSGRQRRASLVLRTPTDEPQVTTALVSDLVVVAEFRDAIYPGLRSTGGVARGGEKPHHTVISGENYHVLQALSFICPGEVDCIYIDPPYNTRDKDWKYNNDYVDADDRYRHSKWLAMMERRLLLAKQLLARDAVLVVTIDEKEYLRLGLLLEQVFPEARIQMVSAQINPANSARPGAFARNDEYVFFVMFGAAAPQRLPLSREWVSTKGRTFTGKIRWDLLRRSGTGTRRKDSPGGFYPIYVDPDGPKIHSIGAPLPEGISKAPAIKGAVPVLPIRKDGSEGRWQLSPRTLRGYLEQGRVRIGGSAAKGFVIYYLKPGEFAKIESGEYPVAGRLPDGSLEVGDTDGEEVLTVPPSQWHIAAHDSTQYGSRLLASILPDREFPFPKSLYAVEDSLRFFLANKPHALVLDFFAGSGTTTHAIMRLNKQDGGRRRSIIVTNNEVSAEEAATLRSHGHVPGSPAWEHLGICEHITKPRIEAAITGMTPEGAPIKGAYKFGDEFPMADGFEENAEFFALTYEDPERVRHGLDFEAIAPLLWFRAGCEGARIDCVTGTFTVADTYAVLFDPDAAAGFVAAVRSRPLLRIAYIVTDDETQFQVIAGQLPQDVKPLRLYAAYLDNFGAQAGA